MINHRMNLLGLPVDNVTMPEATDYILQCLEGKEPCQVCFVNADCANISYRDSEYRGILQAADFVFADGIGMKIAGKFFAEEIRGNVNGTDLFPLLCQSLAGTGKGIFLLGAKPGIAEAVSQWIRKHHPGVLISGHQHGYFPKEEEAAVVRRIADSGAALLLVAYGAPLQEKWIMKHLKETGVTVAMGVGGLFDFYSSRIPRAPFWMRKTGMEWVYRLYQEPRRMWKRYLIGNFVFMGHVLMERFAKREVKYS